MGIFITSFISCLIIFSFAAFTLFDKRYKKYYAPAKILNSLTFLVNGAVMGYLGGSLQRTWELFPALLLCFLGDLFLAFHHMRKKTIDQVLGAVSFFMAHIVFLALMIMKQKVSWIDFVFPILYVIFIVFLSTRKNFDFGKVKAGAYIYAFLIAEIAFKGFWIAVQLPTTENIIFAVGAFIFFVSDFLIYFIFFYKRRFWLLHGINLGIYYLAMYLITTSIYFSER